MDPLISAPLLDGLPSQPDALIAIILRQADQIEALLNDNTSLRLQVHSLNERLRKLEGQNHPPAAPFGRTRDTPPTKPPGKPGRKPGHKPDCKPIPAQVDEFVEAPLPPRCPRCESALQALQPLDQHIEDIIAKKHLTHLRTHQGYCPKCECVVASTHPRQVSWAAGAASTHLGARALAMACMLKHQMGLSFAKTSETLRAMCGITISPGGLAQLFQRSAGKLEADYEALHEQLLKAPSMHTDETSWWVDGPKASLCVFCNPRATYYRVVESKNRETFHEVIPPDWPGVLVSDCLGVYDEATPHQQKCHAHHLKAIAQAREQGADASPGSFLGRSAHLLRAAMEQAEGWEKRAPPEREEQMRALKLAAKVLLERPIVDKPQQEAVRARLEKQKDHLFVFLEREGVEATNNLAERQLRPAVIARKISCGQRTWEGAKAWQVLASLAASARQTSTSFIDLVALRCSLAPR